MAYTRDVRINCQPMIEDNTKQTCDHKQLLSTRTTFPYAPHFVDVSDGMHEIADTPRPLLFLCPLLKQLPVK